jgi:hypothetical protein
MRLLLKNLRNFTLSNVFDLKTHLCLRGRIVAALSHPSCFSPACINGSTQQSHIAKEEATALTVTSEAIFIQGTIFAHEGRDFAMCDIPGAFHQADNPDYVLMRLDGILAELMVQVSRPSIINM